MPGRSSVGGCGPAPAIKNDSRVSGSRILRFRRALRLQDHEFSLIHAAVGRIVFVVQASSPAGGERMRDACTTMQTGSHIAARAFTLHARRGSPDPAHGTTVRLPACGNLTAPDRHTSGPRRRQRPPRVRRPEFASAGSRDPPPRRQPHLARPTSLRPAAKAAATEGQETRIRQCGVTRPAHSAQQPHLARPTSLRPPAKAAAPEGQETRIRQCGVARPAAGRRW